MSSGQFEQMICDAIETLVDRAVAKADYDKTIQATILEHTDATIGKYKVKYQDSTFYAYAADVDANYSKGSNVYILVHSNDMEKDKTIIGSVEKLGLDYVPIIEDEDAYDKIGENCVEKTDDGIGLCSYERNPIDFTEETREDLVGDSLVLYDASLEETHEAQKLDLIEIEAIEHYMKQSTSLICGATFRTILPEEQKKSATGNYGIEFDLAFNNNGEEVIRTYHININDMEGDPYNFSVGSQQYEIFDIDGANFIRIDKVKIFCAGFPVAKEGQANDIFVTNVLIQAANRFSEEDLNGCFLSLVTPQGSIFKEGSRDILNLEAILRVKGKVVGDTQDVKYYWFRENPSITRESPKFHLQGGLGWECLNETTTEVIKDTETGQTTTETITEFEPLGAIYQVKAEDVKSKSARYKCVAAYNNNSFAAEVTLLNFNFEYELLLATDSGNIVFHNSGEPIITCTVNQVVGDKIVEVTDLKDYLFSWGEVNSYGQFTSWKSLADLNKGQDNQIQVNINKILTFATYKCAVYLQDGENSIYIGSAAIQLSNAPEQEDIELYSLVINNGTQVFKYNEAGVSPASKSLDSPLIIPELSFSLFDPTGQEVKPVDTNIWYFPIENTMLQLSYSGETVEKDGYYVITNPKDGKLSYTIKETYDPSLINNTIKLVVTNNGTTYVETTSFLFIKEGDAGTNGTEYILRILPNVKPDAKENPLYPMVTKIGDTETYKWNFDAATAGEYLRLQMWKSGEIIYEGTDFGDTFTNEAFEIGEETAKNPSINIEWVNLAHHYTSKIFDKSNIDITHPAKTAIFTANYKEEDAPANIIQARVAYNNAFYSAAIPIITSWVADATYSIALKEGSGFTSVVYSADGMFPQYNRNTPFEIELKGLDNLENLSYNWNIKGEINQKALVTPYLEKIIKEKETDANQAWFRPIDRCNAEALTIGVYCEVKNGEDLVAWIHIPVHFLLNRYGQAALNGWDGNSIDINKEGGYILSPQIGAGKKEEDNSFTGILMGEVKEYKGTSEIEHTGIIGYHQGVKSLFINAEDGSAIFGKFAKESTTPTGGQIIIDPSSDEALLYSSNFFKNYGEDGKPTNTTSSNEAKQGMIINLSKPEIRFGNNNFSVNSNGHIHAAGGGDIAGWELNDYALFNKGNDKVTQFSTGMSSWDNAVKYEEEGSSEEKPILDAEGVYFEVKTPVYKNIDDNSTTLEPTIETNYRPIAFWAGADKFNKEKPAYAKFFVSHDGYLNAVEGTIGSGSNPIFIGKSTVQIPEIKEQIFDEGGNPILDEEGNPTYNIIQKAETKQYSALFTYTKPAFEVGEKGFYFGENGISIGKWEPKENPFKGIIRIAEVGDKTAAAAFRKYGNYARLIKGNVSVSNAVGFSVDSQGNFVARKGFIGANELNGWNFEYNKIWNGRKQSATDLNDGFYIGTDGLGIGVAVSNLNYWVDLVPEVVSPFDSVDGFGAEQDQIVKYFYRSRYPAFFVLGGIDVGEGSFQEGLVGISRGILGGTWIIDRNGITSSNFKANGVNYRNRMPFDEPIDAYVGNTEEKDTRNVIEIPSEAYPIGGKQSEGDWGVRLNSHYLPQNISKSMRGWSFAIESQDGSKKKYGYGTWWSYQRIIAGKYRPQRVQDKETKRWAWELLDDGTMYARMGLISTNRFAEFDNNLGLYFGPEGLRAGKKFKIDNEGNILEIDIDFEDDKNIDVIKNYGGVGKKINETQTEVFNGYTDNKVGYYTNRVHVEGGQNFIEGNPNPDPTKPGSNYWSYCTHIEGFLNEVYGDSKGNHIGGGHNLIRNSEYNVIHGWDNKIIGAYGNSIIGFSNQIQNGIRCLAAGFSNKIIENQESFICGHSNTMNIGGPNYSSQNWAGGMFSVLEKCQQCFIFGLGGMGNPEEQEYDYFNKTQSNYYTYHRIESSSRCVNLGQANIIKNGQSCLVTGFFNRCSGTANFMTGENNICTGSRSYIEGLYNVVSGTENHVEGHNNEGKGQFVHVEGFDNIGAGRVSHIEGQSNIIGDSSQISHLEGYYNYCTGDRNHIEGSNNVIFSSQDHGDNHAMGMSCIIQGERNFIGGYQSNINGISNIAFGYQCLCQSSENFAGGWGASATGKDSFSYGFATEAKASCSFAFGHSILNATPNSLSIGIGNLNSSNDLFEIGNGKDSQVTFEFQKVDRKNSSLSSGMNNNYLKSISYINNLRSNAFSVSYTGTVKATQSFRAGRTGYAEAFKLTKNLYSSKENLLGRFVYLNEEGLLDVCHTNIEDSIGIVAACPAIGGNSFDEYTDVHYITDVFGRFWPTPNATKNPEEYKKYLARAEKIKYSLTAYIPLEERNPYSLVVLTGTAVVRQDGSCQVGDYCTCNYAGEAVPSYEKTAFFITEVIDKEYVKVLINPLISQKSQEKVESGYYNYILDEDDDVTQAKTIRVNFSKKFKTSSPVVTANLIESFGFISILDRDETGFTVSILLHQGNSYSFNWIATENSSETSVFGVHVKLANYTHNELSENTHEELKKG